MNGEREERGVKARYMAHKEINMLRVGRLGDFHHENRKPRDVKRSDGQTRTIVQMRATTSTRMYCARTWLGYERT